MIFIKTALINKFKRTVYLFLGGFRGQEHRSLCQVHFGSPSRPPASVFGESPSTSELINSFITT